MINILDPIFYKLAFSPPGFWVSFGNNVAIIILQSYYKRNSIKKWQFRESLVATLCNTTNASLQLTALYLYNVKK